MKDTLTSLLHYSETSEGGNTPEDFMFSNLFHAYLFWYKFRKKKKEYTIWEICRLADKVDTAPMRLKLMLVAV